MFVMFPKLQTMNLPFRERKKERERTCEGSTVYIRWFDGNFVPGSRLRLLGAVSMMVTFDSFEVNGS